ncbi:hypothetical protein PISMIDRAFT_12593 [Pisolithus microcarpus 441]|uniref:Uncharacterized protein n=1 Tax=Pisolithus microcarpus 441 TaxID=765257 RepID=A0A0C9Y8H5_9AGAM|nr:hypothetical protein PISMIDRAFT_12593 [Pisolithus microcarpus 441]
MSEKPVRPKPRPQSTDQRKGDLEVETKSDTAREIDQELSEIGPKARKKTILKLRSAIEQARDRIGAETEPGAAMDTGHEQAEIGSKPRGDKIMLKLRGAMEKVSKSQGTAALSGHVQATCENKVVNETPQSETPKRRWGFSELDPPTPDEERMVNLQMASDRTVVIVDDEYSSVENVDMADVFDTQPVNEPAPMVTSLKWKRSGTAGDGSEHTSEADTASKEEIGVIGEIARGHRVTSKTSVSAIDTDKLQKPTKGIGPRHPSDSVPASDFPESETTWASNSSSQFTNGDLPPLFLKGRKWAKLFLPTLLLWIRDQPNIWSVPEDNLVHALTEIAKVVYPTFNTLDDIRPNMPIFAVVRVLFLCDTVLMCCIGKSMPVWMASLFGLYGHRTCGLLSCQRLGYGCRTDVRCLPE